MKRLRAIRRQLVEDGASEAPKAYVAGPMRGIPEYNAPAFAAATERLRAAGFDVFSPSEEDIALGIQAPPTGRTRKALRQFPIGADLKFIAEGDVVFLLEGWERSEGAQLEAYVARYLGVPLYTYPEGKEVAHVYARV
jgi:hypothetical protein